MKALKKIEEMLDERPVEMRKLKRYLQLLRIRTEHSETHDD